MQPRVTYYTIPPPASLTGFVRMFWVYEIERGDEPYVYRSMADGCAEMIFHYHNTFEEVTDAGIVKQGHAMLQAQSQTYRRFVTRGSFGIFGAYLYPFALPHLFRLSASEASNHMPDLHTLLGVEGRILEEQMMMATCNRSRAAILSAFLESKLKNIPLSPAVYAIRQVIHARELMPVSDIASHFNLSTRQLERKFNELAGFSPKTYMRIIRFHAALNQYDHNANRSLTDIALDCGYYDQSHFIRDFKSFSGYHPGIYFKGQAEGKEYLDA